ncbi:DUF167 domain-containing protein [uncultured Pelagimonas sp.]|uniref:DUF167 domain-containing protein n=1 Tax=uncultured Pelagimonas sp. TaxID=1618102 RepID=UPI00262A1B12|nr:DUF167 domain-containing protein [uncultured Pelagimonas sp.]
MRLPDLTDLALSETTIAVRVSPKASRNAIERKGGEMRIYVTTVPENGKANAAVIKLLAKALGVPKSRLSLIRGETSRDKVIRID